MEKGPVDPVPTAPRLPGTSGSSISQKPNPGILWAEGDCAKKPDFEASQHGFLNKRHPFFTPKTTPCRAGVHQSRTSPNCLENLSPCLPHICDSAQTQISLAETLLTSTSHHDNPRTSQK